MITVHGKQVGPTTTEGSIRHHRVLIDRPEAKGGADRGAMGGELLLMSLGGCFMSNLLAAIIAREADVTNVQVEVSGEVEDAPQRYVGIHLNVSAKHSDADLFQKLVTIAERGCLVANSLKQGIPLTVSVVDAIPEPQPK